MHPSVRRLALIAMACGYLARGSDARGQSNAAIAQQLFLDGRKLMEAGSIAEACSKFADSQRLDPAVGTLMHLATCHERMGKLAAAWSEFTDVAAQAHKAGQAEREKYAHDHAVALGSKVPKVVIELSHPPEGIRMTLDGAPLPLGILGTELPLDPGDHSLEVIAPGMKPWRQAKLNLAPSAVVTRVRVTLEEDTSQGSISAAPGAQTGATSAAPGAQTAATAAAAPEQAGNSSNATRRVIGYGLGGLGLVSLVVAVGEEVTSMGRNNDESKYPAGSTERQTVSDQASAAQTYAIVFGAVGVATIGAGVYLVLSSRDQAATAGGRLSITPLVARGATGATVRFAW